MIDNNEYTLPPPIVITNCPSIRLILATAKNKKHAKYLAAQLILGQPFNFKRQVTTDRRAEIPIVTWEKPSNTILRWHK